MLKRLKHVYETSEVAHIFFHKPEGLEDARNSANNFSWEDNTFYSYSSKIAIADFEKKILLFRNAIYSPTTSKHQWYVKRAVPHDWKIYYWENWRTFSDKEQYILERVEKIKKDKECIHKNGKYFGNPDLISTILNNVQQFCIDLECPALNLKYQKEIENLKWTPEEKSIYSIKQWALINNIKGSFSEKLKLYENRDAVNILEHIRIKAEKYQKTKERLEATKEEREIKRLNKSIEEWYNGEKREINFGKGDRCWSTNPIYLRINPNNSSEVQTSKGITVSLAKCKLLYRIFQKQVFHEIPIKAFDNETFTVGNYKIEKIYLDKQDSHYKLLAGCHLIFDTQIYEFVNRFTDWNINKD